MGKGRGGGVDDMNFPPSAVIEEQRAMGVKWYGLRDIRLYGDLAHFVYHISVCMILKARNTNLHNVQSTKPPFSSLRRFFGFSDSRILASSSATASFVSYFLHQSASRY